MGVGGLRHVPAALPSGMIRHQLNRRLLGNQGQSRRVSNHSLATHINPLSKSWREQMKVFLWTLSTVCSQVTLISYTTTSSSSCKEQTLVWTIRIKKKVEKETLRKSSEISFSPQPHWTEEYQKLRRRNSEMWRRTIYWVAANCREQPAVSTLYRHTDNSVRSSQTVVPSYQTTRYHIPVDQRTTVSTSHVNNCFLLW